MKNYNKITNSLWIIFSFLITINGIGFVYIGSKTSNPKWVKEGIIYEIPWIIVILIVGLNPTATTIDPGIQALATPFIIISIILMIISIVRSILVNSQFQRILLTSNHRKSNNRTSSFILTVISIIPVLNGIPIIDQGFKASDIKSIVLGIISILLWFIGAALRINFIMAIATVFIIISLITFIKNIFEFDEFSHSVGTNRAPVKTSTIPKKEAPKSENLTKKENLNLSISSNPYSKYKLNIRDLKESFDKKETKVTELVTEHFRNSDITYSRFMNSIENSHKNFYVQAESALKIIDLTTEPSEKIEENIKKKIGVLRLIDKKIGELITELIMHDNTEEKNEEDLKILVDDMEELIDSVKDYK